MQLITNLKDYEKDLIEMIRVFYPKNSSTEEGVTIFHEFLELEDESIKNTYKVMSKEGELTHTRIDDKAMQAKHNLRKLLQLGLYEALSKHTKINMPWGALIGIRPVKMAQDLLASGLNRLSLLSHLKNTYYVSEEKCQLISEIIDNQGYIIKNDKLINLYINIPFCVSRCSYCSFMSTQIDASKNQIEPYVEALVEEINHAKELIKNKSYIVKSVYVGGGTPTALNAKQLEKILKELNFNVSEFTVEAGRADTITKEKLQVLKAAGVTRISINPQTFNNKVLKRANRQHTVEEFLQVYKMALPFDFVINMDLIAGLSGESLKSFKEGINTILELSPHNITIHTLALKRASTLNKNAVDIFKDSKAEKMLEYAYIKLKADGYKPYYMYRQKNMLKNLENIGFSKGNTNCNFNIDSIDDYASVLACGAGAISKRIYLSQNKKEQAFNVKGIKEYIERLDEMKTRKEELFG
jgi:coproporphyrinogen dehydrogenase HemZ